MKQYILALDQGTTSSRSLVFDHGGRILGMAQQEFTQHFPQPGWVEHDPEDILSGQLATAREAVSKAGLTMADIAAVGITNQRETTVVWDRATGKAIHNALGNLGFDGVGDVRQGKVIDLELAETDEAAARAKIEDMCQKLLANTVIENYAIELGG